MSAGPGLVAGRLERARDPLVERRRPRIQIGEPAGRGRGLGSEAIRLLLAYGFETLGLHRIELRVHENNPRAIRCYERAGFRREGEKREARWWAGRWWSVFEYAILESERNFPD